MSSRLEFSLASDGLEQDPRSGERLDGVIPDPLNLRAGELPHHPSEQGGELGARRISLGGSEASTLCTGYIRWTFCVLRTIQSKWPRPRSSKPSLRVVSKSMIVSLLARSTASKSISPHG